MIEIVPDGTGVVIRVKARAGARRDAIEGEHDRALKVAVTAAPEKGKANSAIVRLLADALGLRPADVSIVRGETSPHKTVRVQTESSEVIAQRLADLLASMGS